MPKAEELSGIGAAYAAGLGLGLYSKEELFAKMERKAYEPRMDKKEADRKYQGWKAAVETVLEKK